MPYDWDETRSVGVEHLDAEHRHILRRVRHLAAAVAEGRPEEIAASLKFLHGYLFEHFADEEDWMADTGYPGARDHERHHAALLDAVTTARLRGVGRPDALRAAAAEIASAVDEHMRTEDLKLGRFVTARDNLKALAEVGPAVRLALAPIPGRAAGAERREEEARPADAVERVCG
jgi:hemerythrin